MSPGYEPGVETVSPSRDLGYQRQPVNRPEPTGIPMPAPVISVVMLVHARIWVTSCGSTLDAFFDHLSTWVRHPRKEFLRER